MSEPTHERTSCDEKDPFKNQGRCRLCDDRVANLAWDLLQGVKKLHAAKGRHHTQIAAAELFERAGLDGIKPKTERKNEQL